LLVAIGAAAGIATIFGLGWMIYTYYKPRTQQTGQPLILQAVEPRLSQSLPAKMVNEAVVFLDWVQKNHNAYIRTYPSFAAIRPYLTILQQDGFIEESSATNMDGTVYQLTAEGQKALLKAGVKLL
jgi:hypothetical protein